MPIHTGRRGGGAILLELVPRSDQSGVADSDPRTARRTLETLRPNVQTWVNDHPDPDILDDLKDVNAPASDRCMISN